MGGRCTWRSDADEGMVSKTETREVEAKLSVAVRIYMKIGVVLVS